MPLRVCAVHTYCGMHHDDHLVNRPLVHVRRTPRREDAQELSPRNPFPVVTVLVPQHTQDRMLDLKGGTMEGSFVQVNDERVLHAHRVWGELGWL